MRRLLRDKIQLLLGPISLIFPFFLCSEVIVVSGSLKVFVISAMQAQQQRVSASCNLSVLVRPFHLGLGQFILVKMVQL